MLGYSLSVQSPSAHGRDVTKPAFPLRSPGSCSVPPHCSVSPGLSLQSVWSTAAMMGQTRSHWSQLLSASCASVSQSAKGELGVDWEAIPTPTEPSMATHVLLCLSGEIQVFSRFLSLRMTLAQQGLVIVVGWRDVSADSGIGSSFPHGRQLQSPCSQFNSCHSCYHHTGALLSAVTGVSALVICRERG